MLAQNLGNKKTLSIGISHLFSPPPSLNTLISDQVTWKSFQHAHGNTVLLLQGNLAGKKKL